MKPLTNLHSLFKHTSSSVKLRVNFINNMQKRNLLKISDTFFTENVVYGKAVFHNLKLFLIIIHNNNNYEIIIKL